MAYYFSFEDIVNELKSDENRQSGLDTLIRVSTKTPSDGSHPGDALVLDDLTGVLDLDAPAAAGGLKTLLDASSLYRLNLELLLDTALDERHSNEAIAAALHFAFEDTPLPTPVPKGTGQGEGDRTGSLLYPYLGHADAAALCHIYTRFLAAAGGSKTKYDFEKSILGKHESVFLGYFCGFVHGGQGRITARRLLEAGRREKDDVDGPAMTAELLVRRGRQKAREMSISEPREMLWAWLEADNFQARRAREIVRIGECRDMAKNPGWIKADISAMLEKEAAKQVFSESLLENEISLQFLNKMPLTEKAVRGNSRGGISPFMRNIMGENADNLSTPAVQFIRQAAERAKEARRAKVTS